MKSDRAREAPLFCGMNRNSAANVQPKSAGLRLVEPGEGSPHPCHAAQSKNAPMGRFVWSG